MTPSAVRSSRRIALWLLGAVLTVGAARGEDVSPPAPPAPVPDPPGIDVTGFVDAYYSYGSNRVDPLYRTFDIRHDAFSVSLAEVAFAKPAAPTSRVGFRVDLDFGKTADLVAGLEPETGGAEIYKHLQQAYLSVLTGRVTWDVGRFVTPIGAEVIESQDNWNYTRSILFGYAIPFNHTGIRSTWAASDQASFSGFVLNGWNAASEVNGNKTFALNATLKPVPPLSWAVNYMAGEEVDDGDTRHLFDTTATWTLSERLSVMGNFDYGKEGPVKWWGVAGYARYQVRPRWALAGRYEYVDDSAGGFMLLGTTAQSLTLTSDHTFARALKARVEYRTDFTGDDLLPRHDGTLGSSQTSITVGLVAQFGGKIGTRAEP
jgi:hypothetical protein